jgi:Fe-S cluster assembly protein SufD
VDPTEPTSPEPVEAALAVVRSYTDSTVPDVSRADRVRSRAVADFAVPGGREEEWRFTPLPRVRALFEPAETSTAVAVSVRSDDAAVSVTDHAPEESVARPGDRVAAVAQASAGVRRTVRVAADAVVAEPVQVDLVGTGGRGAVDLVIDVGAFSRATVVLDHTGDAEFAGTVGIRVGESATVTVVSLQSWERTATHVGQHDAVLGRDSTFRHIAVSLGGDLVRLDVNVEYTGPGASSSASASTSPTPVSTWSTGSSWTTPPRPAAATSCTRARCRARTRTPCGSATS